MIDSLPIWFTAQLCLVLYLAAITTPYFFTYISPKRQRELIETSLQRYRVQRRRQDERLRRQKQEQERLARQQYSRAWIQQSQLSSSSSSTSTSSTSSSSEEEEEEEMIEQNTPQVLEQYKNRMDNIIDLFDGQASMTSTSAATTIIVEAPRRTPGKVLHI